MILLSCRSKLIGKYKDNGLGRYYLKLKKDKTYRYCYSYDTYHVFSYGIWKLKKDTLFLTKKILHDTVRLKYKDSLIISTDEKADIILQKDSITYNNFLYSLYMSNDMILHPQRIIKSSNVIKFIVKNKRLYKFKDTKVDSAKQFIMIKQ